jgi:hypothetical protein
MTCRNRERRSPEIGHRNTMYRTTKIVKIVADATR